MTERITHYAKTSKGEPLCGAEYQRDEWVSPTRDETTCTRCLVVLDLELKGVLHAHMPGAASKPRCGRQGVSFAERDQDVTCAVCRILLGQPDQTDAGGEVDQDDEPEIACSQVHDHDPKACAPDWADMLGGPEVVRRELTRAETSLSSVSMNVSVWAGWQGWADHPVDDRHRAGLKAFEQLDELVDVLSDLRVLMRRQLKPQGTTDGKGAE